ncbi:Uu.00g009140.m01.CDS01 [Anthostomella pinea]|uniref:Uu.00g009140.m01.CDS01 n=1 Tax=Anthostomella pinea TaxID=933095 RepID=A0AAI8VY80_9PEZI|nr:Uu.00g009140.m01.CDS01 [Anthostomella pinea]
MLGRGLMPFSIGNDICQISRIHKIIASKARHRFVHRILTPEERQQPRAVRILECILDQEPEASTAVASKTPSCDNAQHHAQQQTQGSPALRKAAQYMAGRFAAKEAVMKAHPRSPRLTWDQIVISTAPADPIAEHELLQQGGNPSISTGPPQALIRGNDVYDDMIAPISISHDGDYATAVCLGYRQVPKAQ